MCFDVKSLKVPVVFHNLRGYDFHFIMREIGEIDTKQAEKVEQRQMHINCIPNNLKKYMAFMLGENLVLIDNFPFMASRLDNLAKNLPVDAFKYTTQEFQDEIPI